MPRVILMDLSAFASSYALIVLTPGPNLGVVLASAAAGSRQLALSTAAGAAVGAASLTGTVLAVAQSLPAAALPAPVLGLPYGLLLMWVGAGCLRGRHRSTEIAHRHVRRGFLRGLATGASNPFTAMFVLAFALASPGLTGLDGLRMMLAVTGLAGGWLGLAALAVTCGALRRRGPQIWPLLERTIGVLLIGLGTQAIAAAVRIAA